MPIIDIIRLPSQVINRPRVAGLVFCFYQSVFILFRIFFGKRQHDKVAKGFSIPVVDEKGTIVKGWSKCQYSISQDLPPILIRFDPLLYFKQHFTHPEIAF